MYGIYLGPIGVPMLLRQGPGIYHIATWTLWATDLKSVLEVRLIEVILL